MNFRNDSKTPSLMPIPIRSALPKLKRVPINTYSVFPVLLSLYLNTDLAVIINPMAVYCCNRTNTIAIVRSMLPIHRPALARSFLLSSVTNKFNVDKQFLIIILAGFTHKRNPVKINKCLIVKNSK